MKRILVVVLAFVMIMSLAAAAFAAGSPGTPPGVGGGAGAGAGAGGGAKTPLVKFHTGEVKKGIKVEAPYTDEVKEAIELADKVVKGIDNIDDEAVKAFLEENSNALAKGVISMGENAVEGSVNLAVSATGYDKVMFDVPGNSENLVFVIVDE